MLRTIVVISILLAIGLGCKKATHKTVIQAGKSIQGLLPSTYHVSTHDLGLGKLSEYNFFTQPLKELAPAQDRIIAYDLNSPLFTDYASKKRFIVLPQNTAISYKDNDVLDFPDGTILIKNFYYKASELSDSAVDKLIETRLLIKNPETKKWDVLPYVWNEEQSDAYLYILGKDIDIQLTGHLVKEPFVYTVPNINTCKNCHNKNQEVIPIGPTARQLNRQSETYDQMNQLTYLESNNYLKGMPEIDIIESLPNYSDTSSGTLESRARAYLDINCAHCHQDGGAGKTSGLHLNYHQSDNYKLGIGKPPVAAGKGSGNLSFDIVKGKPEESIVIYRMNSLELDVVMPEIGKNLRHEEGIDLISDWISSLD